MNFHITTVGVVPFAKDQLADIAKNLGTTPQAVLEWDAHNRLRIRGKDLDSKIIDRAKAAFNEYEGALHADHIIVNPYGEDNIAAWENHEWGVKLVVKQLVSIVSAYKAQKILLVMCGPSCVGKGPLTAALFQTELNIGKATIYVDSEQRPPRADESEGKPYHFRTLDALKNMVDNEPLRYLSFDVRGVTQVLDLKAVDQLLQKYDIAFLEVYYTVIPLLRRLRARP